MQHAVTGYFTLQLLKRKFMLRMFQMHCFTFHLLQVQRPQSHGRNLCRAECKNLFSGIYGANFALIEPDKAVGNIQKVIQTVFGNHQCFSFRFQLQQNIFQLLNGSGVQVGRRLIQNKKYPDEPHKRWRMQSVVSHRRKAQKILRFSKPFKQKWFAASAIRSSTSSLGSP